MGRNMLDHTDEEAALHCHLTAKHYPPIHECFLPIAQQVIERAVAAVHDANVWNEQVLMPNGRPMTVRAIHDALNLDEFVRARIEKGS